MDKDVTRLAVERAVTIAQKVREVYRTRVPYGPTSVRMKPDEARRFIQRLDPDSKTKLVESMGIEKWEAMMEKLYARQR